MIYQTKARIVSLGLLIGFCGIQGHGQNMKTSSVAFPEHARATSPDRRYALINVDSDTEPYHTVSLEDRSLKTRRMVFHYDRSVDVLWNPDSKSFALTDYAGSDISACSVVDVDQKVPTIDVWEEILKRIAANERKTLLGNHHVYIAATRWEGSKTLKVKIWGYGDQNPHSFTRFYSYDLGGHVRPDKP